MVRQVCYIVVKCHRCVLHMWWFQGTCLQAGSLYIFFRQLQLFVLLYCGTLSSPHPRSPLLLNWVLQQRVPSLVDRLWTRVQNKQTKKDWEKIWESKARREWHPKKIVMDKRSVVIMPFHSHSPCVQHGGKCVFLFLLLLLVQDTLKWCWCSCLLRRQSIN